MRMDPEKTKVPSFQDGIYPDENAVVVRDLVKIYKGSPNPALTGLNFTVPAGKIYGLLGPNGAGKTTAVSILSTLLQPTSGSIRICGVDAVQHPRRVKGLIGLVPQNIALYTPLTARENLRYFGRICGLEGRRLEERVQACLELAGLENRADQRVAEYSGGMKRRANLAVGLIHNPRLLLLDEPTVGIDAQSRNMILEKLSLLKEQGATMIYTTHYMDEVARLCDLIAIIDEGRIIAEGSLPELLGHSTGCNGLGELFLALTGKELRD